MGDGVDDDEGLRELSPLGDEHCVLDADCVVAFDAPRVAADVTLRSDADRAAVTLAVALSVAGAEEAADLVSVPLRVAVAAAVAVDVTVGERNRNGVPVPVAEHVPLAVPLGDVVPVAVADGDADDVPEPCSRRRWAV